MREAVTGLSDAEIAALGFGDLVSHCREAGVRDGATALLGIITTIEAVPTRRE